MDEHIQPQKVHNHYYAQEANRDTILTNIRRQNQAAWVHSHKKMNGDTMVSCNAKCELVDHRNKQNGH